MHNTWTLAKIRIRLALRSKVALFFTLILPLGLLLVYAAMFAQGQPERVAYVLAAVLALTVMGSFWGMSAQLVAFRERGILRRFRLAPIGPGAMLGSSIVSNFFLILPTVLLEFLIARWVFGLDRWGNLATVLLLVMVGAAAFSSLGLIVASVSNSLQETQVINNTLWMAFLFLSGATIPLPVMPTWVQRAAVFLPATYLVTGLQQGLLRGVSVTNVALDLVALLVTLLLSFFVACQLFRWEPEEKVPARAKLWAVAAVIPFLILGAWENARGQRRAQAREVYEQIQPTNPMQP
jgi:ABC-2 type transport system permease protein